MDNRSYLGDGVYAIHDGFGIWLHANHHEHPTDRIYLEPSIMDSLEKFDSAYRKYIQKESEAENAK